MDYLGNDELKIYRGEDFIIQKHVRVHQPSLSEICDFGEKEYYSMIYNFTYTPQSLKAQLWDIGIDYTMITSYQLFHNLLFNAFPINKTSLLFGDLDFSRFEKRTKDDGSVVLYQVIDNEEVIFDEYTHTLLADYLRKAHYIEKDEQMPANESTKEILIQDARDECEKMKRESNHSQLRNLISAMINSPGFKYNHSQVWDMKINAFMDSVKRICKISDANLLLQSGYSGFGVNLKNINKKQINWLGELD